jgi:hypothetical protein
MQSTPTVTVGLLAVIFIAGFVLGWISSRVRLSGSVSIRPAEGPAQQSGLSTSWTRQTRHLYELKCKCGELIKFRGAHDSGSSDLPPFPESDVYSCPKCGFVFDLKKLGLARQEFAN